LLKDILHGALVGVVQIDGIGGTIIDLACRPNIEQLSRRRMLIIKHHLGVCLAQSVTSVRAVSVGMSIVRSAAAVDTIPPVAVEWIGVGIAADRGSDDLAQDRGADPVATSR
jgi:hypothetical protein